MSIAHDASQLLAKISNEIVKTQKDNWGRGPTAAKSYMFDDMLFVVMQGGLTTAERSMLGFGHEDLVRNFRQVFENEMTATMVDVIEDLTGRKVVNYQSQILFDPDRVIEIFVFDEPAPHEVRAATADGQTSAGTVGAATTDEALDPASDTGG